MLSASLAFLSATTSALLTFPKTEERATQHHKIGSTYRSLRRKLQRFVHVELVRTDMNEFELAEEQKGFDAAHSAIQQDAPPVTAGAPKDGASSMSVSCRMTTACITPQTSM